MVAFVEGHIWIVVHDLRFLVKKVCRCVGVVTDLVDFALVSGRTLLANKRDGGWRDHPPLRFKSRVCCVGTASGNVG